MQYGMLFDVGQKLFYNKGILRVFQNSILENNWVLDIHSFMGNIWIFISLLNILYSFWKVIIGCAGHISGMLFDVGQYLFFKRAYIWRMFQNSIFGKNWGWFKILYLEMIGCLINLTVSWNNANKHCWKYLKYHKISICRG